MIPYKFGDIKFELPQHHGELTLKQFFDLRNCEDSNLINVLSILSGVPAGQWLQCDDVDIDFKIAPALEWLKEPFDYKSFALPSTITINNKPYPVPSGIGLKTFGQKIALQKHYQKTAAESKDLVNAFPYALAIYFQPEITGKPFSDEEAERVLELIEQCKLEEAYPVASFFLTNWIGYLNEKKRSYPQNIHLSKRERVLRGLKGLASSVRYTASRKVLIRLMTKFSRWIITRYFSHYGTRQKQQGIKTN